MNQEGTEEPQRNKKNNNKKQRKKGKRENTKKGQHNMQHTDNTRKMRDRDGEVRSTGREKRGRKGK